jgi:hypothetical protein
MFKFKVENRDLINLGFQLDKWGRVVAKWGKGNPAQGRCDE